MRDPKRSVREQLAVERNGAVVTLTITCRDEYAAIELYDSICAGARDGRVELELETRAPHA